MQEHLNDSTLLSVRVPQRLARAVRAAARAENNGMSAFVRRLLTHALQGAEPQRGAPKGDQ